MKEFCVRGVSGSLYITVILVSLFFGQLAFNLVLFVFSSLAIYEFQKLINHKSFLPIALLFLLLYNLYTLKLNQTFLNGILATALVGHVALLLWLYKKEKTKFNYLFKSILSVGYMCLSCFFIIASANTGNTYNPSIVFLFYLLVWNNNSFAYLVGKKFGKTPLFQSISPKKTWEGFFGGLFFSIITSIIFQYFNSEFSIMFCIVSSLIISILSTFGDLIQSKFKRQANVKDSGSLIPGHGGFYDRMDSVIFAAPWFYLLFNY